MQSFSENSYPYVRNEFLIKVLNNKYLFKWTAIIIAFVNILIDSVLTKKVLISSTFFAQDTRARFKKGSSYSSLAPIDCWSNCVTVNVRFTQRTPTLVRDEPKYGSRTLTGKKSGSHIF